MIRVVVSITQQNFVLTGDKMSLQFSLVDSENFTGHILVNSSFHCDLVSSVLDSLTRYYCCSTSTFMWEANACGIHDLASNGVKLHNRFTVTWYMSHDVRSDVRCLSIPCWHLFCRSVCYLFRLHYHFDVVARVHT